MADQSERLYVQIAALETVLVQLIHQLGINDATGKQMLASRLATLGEGLVTGSQLATTQDVGREVVRIAERVRSGD